MTTPHDLDKLFYVPTSPPSPSFPLRWPGVTAESGKALVETLKRDFIDFHIFFNDAGFHNHTAHHLTALYALGADGELIKAAQQRNAEFQRPAFASPGEITVSNFVEHLGERNYYNSYMDFFISELENKSISAVLEEHVFSDGANFVPGNARQPQMLARFLSSIYHPMIHVGIGCEFNLIGIVAQGLAQAAAHQAYDANLIAHSSFKKDSITSVLPSLTIRSNAQARSEKLTLHGTHAFIILARALKDPLLARPKPGYYGSLPDFRDDTEEMKSRRGRVVELAEQWAADVDLSKPDVLEAKIEEIAWMNALIYGVGGWKLHKPFFADFFLMHTVTSSLFLPSLTHYLSRASQARLLRSFFSNCLALYIARGRPELPLSEFFGSPLPPLGPDMHAEPHSTALQPHAFDHKSVAAPNPWLAIIQSAIYHPEAHVSKAQRALVHWASLFGDRPAGHFAALAEGPDGLKGADKIDGTLFVRAAALTMSTLGWVREGEPEGKWSRS